MNIQHCAPAWKHKLTAVQFKLTLLALHVVGGDSVSACGQRTGEKHVDWGGLVLRVGKAGIPAPAAQRLIGKGALQGASGWLRWERQKRSELRVQVHYSKMLSDVKLTWRSTSACSSLDLFAASLQGCPWWSVSSGRLRWCFCKFVVESAGPSVMLGVEAVQIRSLNSYPPAWRQKRYHVFY